jgi:glycine betaine/proline transport system substrate-binding protein
VANGDIDVYPSAWPEKTHKQYMDEYGDKIEDISTYYDKAQNTIVVPSYSTSIRSMSSRTTPTSSTARSSASNPEPV